MATKKKDEKSTALDLAMTQIERQHGKGSIMWMPPFQAWSPR